MKNEEKSVQAHGNQNTTIEVADTNLEFRTVMVGNDSPTGGQIVRAAGFNESQHPYVLQMRADGDLEDIRHLENADLAGGSRFIVAESSSSNRIVVDGNELDWPADVISGAVLRRLGDISSDMSIYLERENEPDLMVDDKDVIRIGREGVEEFKSRIPIWEIVVQGKRIVSTKPTISVVDALSQAGFTTEGWLIILKVQGQPKRQLSITDSIDLTTPGIEKVHLKPRDVNNGEASQALRRDFALTEDDERYLDELGLRWETEAIGRWLIIHDYHVPHGYNVETVTLALQIVPTYPQTQIDMFFVHPSLHCEDGKTIPQTQATGSVRGVSFQRWSRHRGPGSMWNPNKDNVATQMALVETALEREVEQ